MYELRRERGGRPGGRVGAHRLRRANSDALRVRIAHVLPQPLPSVSPVLAEDDDEPVVLDVLDFYLSAVQFDAR